MFLKFEMNIKILMNFVHHVLMKEKPKSEKKKENQKNMK